VWGTPLGRALTTRRFAVLAAVLLAVPITAGVQRPTSALRVLAIYGLVWLVLSDLRAASIFRELFRRLEVRPLPFHPDGRNGFAPVGRYALDSAGLAVACWFALAVALGFALADLGDWTVFAGAQLIGTAATAADLVLLDTWPAHRAMRRARAAGLAPFAAQSRQTIAALARERSVEGRGKYLDAIEKLRSAYDLVDRSLPVWPFRLDGVTRKAVALLSVASPLLPWLAAAALGSASSESLFESLGEVFSRAGGQ
jgi:hypothetical protein